MNFLCMGPPHLHVYSCKKLKLLRPLRRKWKALQNSLFPVLLIASLFNNAAIIRHHSVYVSFFYFLLNWLIYFYTEKIGACHMECEECENACGYNSSLSVNIIYSLLRSRFGWFRETDSLIFILLLLSLTVFLTNTFYSFYFIQFPFYVKIIIIFIH